MCQNSHPSTSWRKYREPKDFPEYKTTEAQSVHTEDDFKRLGLPLNFEYGWKFA